MRTTVDLDERTLCAVNELARLRGQTLGHALSDLVQSGLRNPSVRNGVPLLMPKPGDTPITSEMVRELLELDD
jgi:hypothetical protein